VAGDFFDQVGGDPAQGYQFQAFGGPDLEVVESMAGDDFAGPGALGVVLVQEAAE